MRLHRLFGFLAPCLFLATAALPLHVAADSADLLEGDGVRIERGAVELGEAARVRPDDRDFVDTALIFTNAATRTIVRCLARDDNGEALGP